MCLPQAHHIPADRGCGAWRRADYRSKASIPRRLPPIHSNPAMRPDWARSTSAPRPPLRAPHRGRTIWPARASAATAPRQRKRDFGSGRYAGCAMPTMRQRRTRLLQPCSRPDAIAGPGRISALPALPSRAATARIHRVPGSLAFSRSRQGEWPARRSKTADRRSAARRRSCWDSTGATGRNAVRWRETAAGPETAPWRHREWSLRR